MSKPRIIKDYEKLNPEVLEQIKLVYPRGFHRHLVGFVNRNGEKRMGLPFETEDYYYLIRMSAMEAKDIIAQDDDYDDDGNLKSKVKRAYEDKHDDLDFLDDLNANEDNDLGMDEEEPIDPSTEDDMDDDF
jgi:hypothetical protein